MSLIIESRNLDGDIVPIAGEVEEKTLDVTENAEEGSVAMSVVTVDDPDLEFDLSGHRLFRIRDTEIVSGESAIYVGYTADRTFKRGRMPLSRQVDLSVADINSVWGRRVMVGADCKRPAETDVARMRWLITTAEAGLIDDGTYLSASSPVNMDKVDYRGQMMDQVANDCAQASGKNWGLTYLFAPGHGFQIWYGHDELATYDSGVLITNILGDVDDETSFYMADDTTLTLDPARVFSGVMLDWEKGKVYRQSSATAHAFARRDTIMGGKLVKTKTKAVARTLRYLNTLNEEDVRIETAILVPRALGNVVRPFHRVQFQSTHLPGTIDSPIYCRVVKRRLSYWTPEFWRIGLTLAGGASAPEAASCSAALGAKVIAQSLDNAYAAATVTISITPAAGASSLIFGAGIAVNSNVPADHDFAAGTSTTLLHQDNPPAGAPLYGSFYRAVSAAAGSYSLNGTYTRGCCTNADSRWGMAAVAIQTSATSPVQSDSATGDNVTAATVTFGAPPTPGNVLLMVAGDRSGSWPYTDVEGHDGWTLLAYTRGLDVPGGLGAYEYVGVYGRCVVAGDPAGPWGFLDAETQTFVSVSEWEIT